MRRWLQSQKKNIENNGPHHEHRQQKFEWKKLYKHTETHRKHCGHTVKHTYTHIHKFNRNLLLGP